MLSAERQDVEMYNGRITAQRLTEFANTGLLHVSEFHSAYLCGPMDMVESVSEAQARLSMNKESIHRELFTTGAVAKAMLKAPIKEQLKSNGKSVTIILDGAQTEIKVDASQDTILEAAQRAGIDMPFSCAGGMCCTCRCKVLEGKTTMDINFSLAQWEVDAGYTLACQSRPDSDKVLLDFDAT